MEKTKYPRTPHVPNSEGATSDDRILSNMDHFIGQEVVVTEKRDGENSSLYSDCNHARSLDSKDHESRHWLKVLHSTIKNDIPENMRICGENLFAKHSIFYDNLKTYFEVFSIWKNDIVLSWDETLEWSELLGLTVVPVLYRGIYTEKIHNYCLSKLNFEKQEGYVMRLARSFLIEDFKISVAKFVRANHVTTEKHWLKNKIIPNKLTKNE